MESVTWNPTIDANQPPTGWLKEVWECLTANFPSDLRVFEKLPILPISSSFPTTLSKLVSKKSILLREGQLDDNVCGALRSCDICVIDQLPAYVSAHTVVLTKYVARPSPSSILQALSGCSTEIFLATTDEVQKRALRRYLSQVQLYQLTAQYKEVLRRLPLFETVLDSGGGGRRFVSLREITMGVKELELDVPSPHPLLDLANQESLKLASVMDIRPMRTTDLLLKVYLPNFTTFQQYQQENLMRSILHRLDFFLGQNSSFLSTLKKLTFIPKDGYLFPASAVFDPQDTLLSDLFAEENCFPTHPYNSDEWIRALRKLGLRRRLDVTPEEIISTAQCIESTNYEVTAKRKSAALLKLLAENSSLLSKKRQYQYNTVKEELQGIAWVATLRRRPSGYPENLAFHQGHSFAEPKSLKSKEMAKLCAASMAIMEEDVHWTVSQQFGWNEPPDTSTVVDQVLHVVQAYNPSEKVTYLNLITELYRQLAKGTRSLAGLQGEEWVWHGDGFTTIENMVSSPAPLDLRPFIYPLPMEMSNFLSLFKNSGMKQSVGLVNVLKLMHEKYEEDDRYYTSEEQDHDLQLAADIVNKLKPTARYTLDPAVKDQIYLPVHTDSDKSLKFFHVTECTYCDKDWLKMGLDTDDIDESNELHFVHPNIPTATAEALGVPPLVSRVLDAEELDLSFGQSEPLTRRLKNLLQDYTDGFAVPKEIIQNADDAGAREVRFLYDERQNEDSLRFLIDEGMRECHGPALWAYNNATFSDEDFSNITKLSGATKEDKPQKIGKFGLGFSAVYNLTDVPSFVSGDTVVIFDPHTTHLGRAIKDKSKPGMRLDMIKNEKKLASFGDQFKPYNGIFGCDLSARNKKKYYSGTLFRLPLRNRNQACRSQINPKHYSHSEMIELLKLLEKGLENLLLFTQNVQKVSVYHLNSDATDPSEAALLYRVEKEVEKVLSSTGTSSPMQMLKSSALTLEDIRRDGFNMHSTTLPKSILLLRVDTSMTADGGALLSQDAASESSHWMVSSCMGRQKSMQLALGDKRLVPTAGVAARLAGDSLDSLVPQPLLHNGKPSGDVFCYLPLPIKSQLPVHVNGGFAVTSNRRHLHEATGDDKETRLAQWNDALWKDAVAEAYVKLLEALQGVMQPNEHLYQRLWPRQTPASRSICVTSLYEGIVLGSNNPGGRLPVVFSDGKVWLNLTNICLLHPQFLEDLKGAGMAEAAQEVLKEAIKGQQTPYLVDLAGDVLTSIDCSSTQCAERMRNGTYTKERFFTKVFFPDIHRWDPERRNQLLVYILQQNIPWLNDLVKKTACIPAGPSGTVLKRPADLIHPEGRAALLYSEEDGRFPSKAFCAPCVLGQLERLGMRKHWLGPEDILERAKSMNKTAYDVACQRVPVLMEMMDNALSEPKAQLDSIKTTLCKTAFLPVMVKPADSVFPWKGDEYSQRLAEPSEMYLPGKEKLVSATYPILDKQKSLMTEAVQKFLGLLKKKPKYETVLDQLDYAIMVKADGLNDGCFSYLDSSCKEIYRYFESAVSSGEENGTKSVINQLSQRAFILHSSKVFYPPSLFAFSSPNLEPYLFAVNATDKRSYSGLLRATGVKEHFQVQDFILALQQMYNNESGSLVKGPLNSVQLKTAVQLDILIAECLEKTPDIDLSELGTIYIPDSEGMLHDSSDLCYNDCPWMPPDPYLKVTHDTLAFKDAKLLGVNTQRQDLLSKCSEGVAFGQKEKLTSRINRILDSYPCDKEILKELLQNADDAGATEIHFVQDLRYHRDEKVFEESWKPLQGPALCVYNNKPFTKSDLQGIQKLGEGSKGTDPTKTGQYGVGFNCVYHLTDAPCLLTEGPEIGKKLCVFDPTCRYVPGATQNEPGRQYDIRKGGLEATYTDVFPCFLPELFPQENFTMFRFPLRTMEMAEQSTLMNKTFTEKMLRELGKKFLEEMNEVMLFVNNIEKISMSTISRDGKEKECHWVHMVLSEEDKIKRQAFFQEVNELTRRIKEGDISIADIPERKLVYEAVVKKSHGPEQRYLIVQQFGFSSSQSVSKKMKDAFASGDLALTPRGSVAVCLDHRKQTNQRAYCFLPLPIKTGLPVVVNGHFALDHESRRDLWSDGGQGYKEEWNRMLLQQVVAPAYGTLLNEWRQLLPGYQPTGNKWFAKTSLKQCLDHFASLFPPVGPQQSYWTILSKAVYQYINESALQVLPVLRPSPMAKASKDFVGLEWFSAADSEKGAAFFNDLFMTEPKPKGNGLYSSFTRVPDQTPQPSSADTIGHVLLALGFNLVYFPLSVRDNFQQAEVAVKTVNPNAVLEYFRESSESSNLCGKVDVPVELKHTPFKNLENFGLILNYCAEAKDLLDNIPGTPLLLTADETLRMFDVQTPTFLTSTRDLLPGLEHHFAHRLLHDNLRDLPIEESKLFKRFDIQAFSTLLEKTNMAENLLKTDNYVAFPEQEMTARNVWLMKVWRFIAMQWRKKEEENSTGPLLGEDQRRLLHQLLQPLREWALLPATCTIGTDSGRGVASVEHYLVPLKMASTLFNFNKGDSLSKTLRETLRKLRLPELNITMMKDYYNSQIYGNLDILCANIDQPAALLESLGQANRLHSLEKILDGRECDRILQYLSDSVEVLKEAKDHITILQRLPFYRTVTENRIALYSCQAYLLPSNIETTEMDAWKRQDQPIVFLISNNLSESFKQFYKLIGCAVLTAVEVYIQFVFPQFDGLLSQEAQIKHLEYLRDKLIPPLKVIIASKNSPNASSELQAILDALQALPFVPNQYGEKMTASNLFDPYEPVFSCMYHDQPEKFPQEPFNGYYWIKFLRDCGLVSEVTKDRLLNFAKVVEEEAARCQSDSTIEKSRVLVKHLYQRRYLTSEGIVDSIKTIRFIAPHKVRSSLNKLSPQNGRMRDGSLPYISFKDSLLPSTEMLVWSVANILPNRANPYSSHVNEEAVSDVSISKGQDKRTVYRRSLVHLLGIVENAEQDLVLRHLENVCGRYKEMCGVTDRQMSYDMRTVMENLYCHLQENCLNEEVKKRLQCTPCIAVRNCSDLLIPTQIVSTIKQEDELMSYLEREPTVEFGNFHKLFVHLGATEETTYEQYVWVLWKLHQECDSELNPNEFEIAAKATKGLFKRTKKLGAYTGPLDLFLPSVDHSMVKSRQLLYCDDPALEGKISLCDRPYLIKLTDCEVKCKTGNFNDVIMKLPEQHRPTLLTSIIQESIDEESKLKAEETTETRNMEEKLSSPEFFMAMKRLVLHKHHNSGESNIEELFSNEKMFEKIKFRVVDVLNTVFSYTVDGVASGKSNESKPYFADISDSSTIIIYVSGNTPVKDDDVRQRLTEIIAMELGGALEDFNLHLFRLLEKPVEEFKSYLDKSSIREYNLASLSQAHPKPGEFVPSRFHHLLRQDIDTFNPGEYVAFELETEQGDFSDEGDDPPSYIYAKVVREMEDVSTDILAQYMYEINIGSDQIITVPAVDLYKFHREKNSKGKALIASEARPSSPASHDDLDLKDVLDEISTTLESAWNLPEDQRHKIIKRLMLKWHPDKNLDKIDFCTEVCQHIRTEIERLEKGLPRPGTHNAAKASQGSPSSFSSNYSSMWDYVNRRAGEHRRERERYEEEVRTQGHSGGGSFSFMRFCGSGGGRNPQPREGRRWLQQALEDLKAAQHGVNSSNEANEWTCYMCHQVSVLHQSML